MSFKTFFNSIAPTLERDRIVRSLEKAFKVIETGVIPSLQFPDGLVANQKIMENLDGALQAFAPDYRGQPITFMRLIATQLVSNKGKLLDIYERSFNKEIVVDAIDYKKAHLLEYAAAIIFFTEYAQKLTFAVTADAIQNVYQKRGVVEEYLAFCGNPAALRTFGIICGALYVKPEKLSQALDAIKGLSFDPESHDLMTKMKGKQVDPMSMNMIPLVGHLSLLFGEMLNAAFDWYLKRAEDSLQATQLHILYLERAKEGASTEELAALEKQITYYRERVAKLEQRIESMR